MQHHLLKYDLLFTMEVLGILPQFKFDQLVGSGVGTRNIFNIVVSSKEMFIWRKFINVSVFSELLICISLIKWLDYGSKNIKTKANGINKMLVWNDTLVTVEIYQSAGN
jgi:hypothetical protein